MRRNFQDRDLRFVPLSNVKLRQVLKEYRVSRKIPQKQMAALLGVTREYYASIESGKRFPSTALLKRICLATRFRDSILSPLAESPDDLDCAICLTLPERDKELLKRIIHKLASC